MPPDSGGILRGCPLLGVVIFLNVVFRVDLLPPSNQCPYKAVRGMGICLPCPAWTYTDTSGSRPPSEDHAFRTR